jgi:hypothetical protein
VRPWSPACSAVIGAPLFSAASMMTTPRHSPRGTSPDCLTLPFGPDDLGDYPRPRRTA